MTGRPHTPRSLPRVLFVDDEPMLLAGVANVLRGHYHVTTATSGSEALGIILASEPFVVIVSDFAMPGMNGAELLAQVRHAAPDAIRVLLTGQATLDGAAAAVNDGHIFRFLIKPCAGPNLLRAVDDAVEQYRLVTSDLQLLEHKVEAMSGHLVRAERLASLGTMAAAVGHELNNVLAAFGGALTFIEEDSRVGILPSLENLQVLRQVKDQLTLHARNLLQFGRPPRGESADHTDLNACVNDVLGMLRLGGRLRHVQIRVNLPYEPVTAHIERAALEQILLNLIKNAVEALDESAHPCIDVMVSTDAAANAVCTVSDNGSGIAASQIPLLFEPYFTTKPPDRGTGLGLFVVRDWLRKSGGTIAVQSTVGTGTTFTFTIPLHVRRADIRSSAGSAA